ncbi:MAG: hypothetical protein ACK50Z_11740 [Betaproteobacteria bacterium]|jgi:hypothetical protein
MSAGDDLPAWAEAVIAAYGPQPAAGAAAADPHATMRYDAIVRRFRDRWGHELEPDVWALFGDDHMEQKGHLLGVMLDLARVGTAGEVVAARSGLDELQAVEDELRGLAEAAVRLLDRRSDLMRAHLLDGGLDDDVAQSFGQAAAALAVQSWHPPRLVGAGFDYVASTRKSQRDSVVLMLSRLNVVAPLLLPVTLTDRARATIFNVVNGRDEYSPEAMKKARADLRNR